MAAIAALSNAFFPELASTVGTRARNKSLPRTRRPETRGCGELLRESLGSYSLALRAEDPWGHDGLSAAPGQRELPCRADSSITVAAESLG
jgi:hypothetical protein